MISRTAAEALVWALHLGVLGVGPRVLGHRAKTTLLVGAASASFATALWLAARDTGVGAFALAMGVATTWTHHTQAATRRAHEEVERERARGDERRARAAVAEERRRLARELHDGLGARLTSLFWRLQRLRRRAPPALHGDLAVFEARAAHALAELRATAWTLRVPTRTGPELLDVVRAWLTERWPDAEVRGLVAAAPSAPFPSDLALRALRAAEEVLREGAPSARVDIRVTDSGVQIAIEPGGDAPRTTLDVAPHDRGGAA